MSQEKQFSYVNDKLNIASCTIQIAKEIIKANITNTLKCWDENINVKKQSIHLIGMAGVGKTEICEQVCEEISKDCNIDFQLKMMTAPNYEKQDILMGFPNIEYKTDKNGKDIPSAEGFDMLVSKLIPTDPNSCGLFVIDEFSRGDEDFQQLMWQLVNVGKIHTKELPKKWFIVTIDNPDEGEYSMNMVEDAAGTRRMLHMGIEISVKEFLNYAIDNNFHEIVVEFIQTYKTLLYDDEAQKQGAVYANPASWERVSDVLKRYDMQYGDFRNAFALLDVEIPGLINQTMYRKFKIFITDQTIIKPADIYNNFSKFEKPIQKLIDNHDNLKLVDLVTGVFNFISTSKPKYKISKQNGRDISNDKKMKNIVDFLCILPVEVMTTFITKIDQLPNDSDNKQYMAKWHATMSWTHEKYREVIIKQVTECQNNQ
jgi:hypothetical protein